MAQPQVRELSCGATLVIEPMSGVKSAGVCVALAAGFATEPAPQEGLSAVMSEVLLRGGRDLDSRAQADAFDRAGASRSANAGGRTLLVRSTTIGSRLQEAWPLIMGMIREPRIETGTVDPARELCSQALASLADEPRERAMLASRRRHVRAPLNRSGYGTAAGLASCTPETLNAWWSGRARPEGCIISVAGAVEAQAVADQLERETEGWAGGTEPIALASGAPGGYEHEEDDTNQVQIIVLQEAPPESDERAALCHKIATNVLGGGMSGRLFTEVREKRGLCYTVSCAYRGDQDYGVQQSYVGTTPERAQESIDVLSAELHRIGTPEGAITPEEFDRAVTSMSAGVVFHGESTGARAGALAGDIQKLGRARSLEEIRAAIASITLDDVNAHVADWRSGLSTVQTLGPTPLTPPPELVG